MGRFTTSDLAALDGESFRTPTWTGDQTVFRFKDASHSHKKQLQALLYTDYFRMANVDGHKCHFTVTLSLKHAPKRDMHGNDFQYVDIRWNNPHLTVRSDLNASKCANTPAVHRGCNIGSSWLGTDDTIPLQNLPSDADAVKMWNHFQNELKIFIGLVESMAEDRSLNVVS